MGTTADKLTRLNETKALLKTRLTEKGLDVASENNFYNLADKVGEISGDDKIEYNITGSGTFPLLPSKAKPGDVIVVSAGYVNASNIYLSITNTNDHIDGMNLYKSLSKVPTVFKKYFEQIPIILAPPVSTEIYSFFIMPPCDVTVNIS